MILTSYIACADTKEVKDHKFIAFQKIFTFKQFAHLPAVSVFFRGIDSYDFAGNSES